MLFGYLDPLKELITNEFEDMRTEEEREIELLLQKRLKI